MATPTLLILALLALTFCSDLASLFEQGFGLPTLNPPSRPHPGSLSTSPTLPLLLPGTSADVPLSSGSPDTKRR